MMTEQKKPLVIIVGATASGKTAAGVELAKRMNGEIISADSRLLYRGMDIGTAKPTQDERQGIPHHLIDVAAPDDVWHLALYQQQAYLKIEEIHLRGKLPILVGGTGQYIRAIREAWEVPAQEPDNGLRIVIEAWCNQIGADRLHQKLRTMDAQAANAIDYRNKRRTIRAIEVIFKTGRKFSEQRLQGESPYDIITLGINMDHEILYQRVDQRIEKMLQDGLIDEVSGLLAKGYSRTLPTLSAIGYQEIIYYLQGKVTLDEAIMLIKRNTRVYVRRQTAWFKPSDAGISWINAGTDLVDVMEAIVKRRLNG